MALSQAGPVPIGARPVAGASGVIAKVVTVLCFVLVGTYLFAGQYQPVVRFHPVFYVSVLIVLAGLRVRGWSVLTRTWLDFFFIAWVLLANFSQSYAGSVLGRIFFPYEILDYFYVIFTSWAVYRAAYALVVMAPRAAPRSLLNALITACLFAALLGVAQDTPLKGPADNVSKRIGSLREENQYQTAEEDTSPRPASVFTSPTMFGSFNTYGTLFVLAIALGAGDRLRNKHLPAIFFLSAIFFAGTFVAQVRIALLYQGLLLMFFILYTIYRSQRTIAIVIVGLVLLGGAFVSTRLSDERFSYLARTFEGGLFQDESFKFRLESWTRISEMAAQIAPLGSGFTFLSSNAFARRGDTYSRANGPDSGYFEAFFLHGIPGLLLFFSLFLISYVMFVRLGGTRDPARNETRWAVMLNLVLFLALGSILGVTHSKFERSGPIYLMLGAGAGLLAVHRPLPVRSTDPAGTPIAPA